MRIKFPKHYSTRRTPQSQPIPGSAQKDNSAGGYSWAVDDWMRLDRFLILGTEGGSFYAGERKLTVDSAEAVRRCIAADGPRVVTRVLEISQSGRAPSNDPAVFVLAMCAKLGSNETRKLAFAALPKVCRIGTHLMHFADFAEAFGGWGRGMRRAVAHWYNGKPADRLAYQLVKYQSRDGWSNRDLLRLSHARPATPAHDRLYRWVVRGELGPVAADVANDAVSDSAHVLDDAGTAGIAMVEAVEAAKRAQTAAEIIRLIDDSGLPRESIPTVWLGEPGVWAALLRRMPLGAMLRNLATMTRVGLLGSMSEATRTVVARLRDTEHLQRARVHPIGVLSALLTYQSGRGVRGKHTWSPVTAIVDALDGAFYRTFHTVEPTGKRLLLGLDVSGSMGWGTIAGVPTLTPRVASAAMALVSAATEDRFGAVAFTGGQWRGSSSPDALTELSISPRQRLDDVVRRVERLSMGPTDCALPMRWALANKQDVDTFIVYTDSETWYGDIHPAQALREYRQQTGIPAKLVVVGMVANGFSIADPNDAGMLDVVGFDTATPSVISDFARA